MQIILNLHIVIESRVCMHEIELMEIISYIHTNQRIQVPDSIECYAVLKSHHPKKQE